MDFCSLQLPWLFPWRCVGDRSSHTLFSRHFRGFSGEYGAIGEKYIRQIDKAVCRTLLSL
jgi:hypothetical protein